MKTIETSSAQEIAEYLEYLYNIARDKALENHPTYSKMYDDNAWEKLYHKVFSEEISRVIYKRFPNFDWYDPDTSYYEDVNAFIEAFKNYAKNISNDSNEDLELFPSINTYFENKDN